MNNLNDPPRWNIQPDRGGGGGGGGGGPGAADGTRWYYALLVPMVALAFFRWIWARDSQREIDHVKSQYVKDVSVKEGELEVRYRDTLTQRNERVAALELELKKEKLRVKGYEQAMSVMMEQQVKKKKELDKERGTLEEEKKRVVQSGAAGAVLHQALERENDWYRHASARLKELEGPLLERQSAFCSSIRPRNQRLAMERNLLLRVVKEPLGAELDLESDLRDIFRKDVNCAERLNTDQRNNGSLMWLYLKHWQLQIALQKHKRAEEALLRGKIPSDNK